MLTVAWINIFILYCLGVSSLTHVNQSLGSFCRHAEMGSSDSRADSSRAVSIVGLESLNMRILNAEDLHHCLMMSPTAEVAE
jgi:hypothetical protein